MRIKLYHSLVTLGGKRDGSVVGASDLGPEGQELKPWLVHLHCALRQNT